MSKIGTKSSIRKTIKDKDFTIKKKFGQNFLVDQNILRKIVDSSSVTNDSLVIEIGPGMGSLTEHLLHKAKHVLAYEIDSDLLPILENTFTERFTLINDDFLHRNIDKDIDNLNMEFDKVVVIANLPYYITTPIIFKILEESSYVMEMLLMMQLEVARRLTSKPKTKDYNALSVVIQYKTNASIALKVPRTVFIPEPNVDSAVVKLEIIKEKEVKPASEEFFFSFVKAAFSQRRKTLVNNIHRSFNIEKSVISDVLEQENFRVDARAESLTVLDFIKLSDAISSLV